MLNAGSFSGAITADAEGAGGSDASSHTSDCMGPGGGGGGVWSGRQGDFPQPVSAVVNGGVNGVVTGSTGGCNGNANSATGGSAGQPLGGYVLPEGTGPVCVPLAASPLQDFRGVRADQGVVLSWTFAAAPTDGIRYVVIQRSQDLSHFDSLARRGVTDDSYTDVAAGDGALAYRLAWQNAAGEWSYSRIVTVARRPGPDGGSVRLFPNPASDRVTMTVVSTASGAAFLTVSNALGQSLLVRPVVLRGGLNGFVVPLGGLAPGVYFLVLNSDGRRIVKSFIRE
ncbi:T9SS type A sorting domain-containing protein [Puia sp. P3]|uniref:T9SS type A sorting domain-containing protein n=1 Tax=Puia sp. P3 TaxID=3423952 RepID=UPI003D6725DE